MVKLIDHNVGELLHQLEVSVEIESTFILFTSDHGDYLGEHGLMGKTGMHECTCKVPSLISFPSKISRTKNIDFLWSTIDFVPTILKLLDIPEAFRQRLCDDQTHLICLPKILSPWHLQHLDLKLGDKQSIIFQ